MEPTIHVLKASGRLAPHEQAIRDVSRETFAKIGTKLKLHVLDVIVCDNPERAIRETGVGGFTPNKYTIYVNVDPGRGDFEQVIVNELPRTLAHEAHHAARWASVGYGDTLLEAMVSEGLADHFDMEVTGGEVPLWARALSAEQMQEMSVRAQKEYDAKPFNEAAWAFGSKELNIPRWTTYSLGFELVGRYIEKTGKKASELVNTPAKDFIA